MENTTVGKTIKVDSFVGSEPWGMRVEENFPSSSFLSWRPVHRPAGSESTFYKLQI